MRAVCSCLLVTAMRAGGQEKEGSPLLVTVMRAGSEAEASTVTEMRDVWLKQKR